jgi:hypothetical protein
MLAQMKSKKAKIYTAEEKGYPEGTIRRWRDGNDYIKKNGKWWKVNKKKGKSHQPQVNKNIKKDNIEEKTSAGKEITELKNDINEIKEQVKTLADKSGVSIEKKKIEIPSDEDIKEISTKFYELSKEEQYSTMTDIIQGRLEFIKKEKKNTQNNVHRGTPGILDQVLALIDYFKELLGAKRKIENIDDVEAMIEEDRNMYKWAYENNEEKIMQSIEVKYLKLNKYLDTTQRTKSLL